ncbi:peptidoglycan-binding domain-containing protein [Actinokineospora iranica]|uniref:Putative peptidoglycan binding domain-containing protein n=1 Tax=Actinokineospora iranica TaxID=1271860 RepID=A0A1G6JXB3_9PSEU|nr:peptidoglycan-binding domain-containing protein [Actinokineospora iranica]SDC23261.1 Putative peptidoglycan binding domain-containing protein [Actinokineospora iranica]
MNRLTGGLTLAFLTAITIGAAPAAAQPAAADGDLGAAATPTCTVKWDYQPALANRSKNCVLGVGNYGPAVRALQESLRYCYGQKIAIDGDFGRGTRSALITVQRRVKVTADGVYGPNTNKKMKWYTVTGCRYNPSGD